MNMKYQLLSLTLLIALSPVQADIFRSVDEKGNPVFTDLPSNKSKPVKLKAPSTYTAPSLPTPVGSSASDAGEEANVDSQAASYYEMFSIVSPGDGEALRDNAGDVNTRLSLEPALNVKAGHRVQYYLDGVASGEPVASLSAVMHQVERGEHGFYAALLNRAGEEITRTETINFQMHRTSINSPARKAKSGS
jgi:hypothetical protein